LIPLPSSSSSSSSSGFLATSRYLVALTMLAMEALGVVPILRCRGGGPGQVDPDTEPPWWRPANLRHPRATTRDRDPCAPAPSNSECVVSLGTPDLLLLYFFGLPDH
jgi:hypothetical protein